MRLVKIGVRVDCGPGLKARSPAGWDCLHRPVGLVQTMEIAMYLICLPLSFWPSGPQQLLCLTALQIFYCVEPLPMIRGNIQAHFLPFPKSLPIAGFEVADLVLEGCEGPQTTSARSWNPGSNSCSTSVSSQSLLAYSIRQMVLNAFYVGTLNPYVFKKKAPSSRPWPCGSNLAYFLCFTNRAVCSRHLPVRFTSVNWCGDGSQKARVLLLLFCFAFVFCGNLLVFQ